MTEITLKKGTGAPASNDLVEGELAIDTTTITLYAKDSLFGFVSRVRWFMMIFIRLTVG